MTTALPLCCWRARDRDTFSSRHQGLFSPHSLAQIVPLEFANGWEIYRLGNQASFASNLQKRKQPLFLLNVDNGNRQWRGPLAVFTSDGFHPVRAKTHHLETSAVLPGWCTSSLLGCVVFLPANWSSPQTQPLIYSTPPHLPPLKITVRGPHAEPCRGCIYCSVSKLVLRGEETLWTSGADSHKWKAGCKTWILAHQNIQFYSKLNPQWWILHYIKLLYISQKCNNTYLFVFYVHAAQWCGFLFLTDSSLAAPHIFPPAVIGGVGETAWSRVTAAQQLSRCNIWVIKSSFKTRRQCWHIPRQLFGTELCCTSAAQISSVFWFRWLQLFLYFCLSWIFLPGSLIPYKLFNRLICAASAFILFVWIAKKKKQRRRQSILHFISLIFLYKTLNFRCIWHPLWHNK